MSAYATTTDAGGGDGSFNSYSIQHSVKWSSAIRPVHEISLAELYSRYNHILWEEGKHKYNVAFFIGELNEILLGKRFSLFSQDMLDNLIGSLRERGNSNATINRKMAALSKLLRKAYAMGEIHSLPEFRRQKEKAGRIRFLEPEEERHLFRAIAKRDEHCHRLAIFLVDTGCRIGEAINLIWNDVNDGRVTFWLTKSGRSRTVPLTKRARQAVEQSRSAADGTGKGAGKGPFSHLTQVHFRKIWLEAKIEAGLGKDTQVVPHILRHTCASRLVQGGVDIRRVQMWLGHQTLQMTMRYAHLATNDLDPCVEVLERRSCPC
jgi:integrase